MKNHLHFSIIIAIFLASCTTLIGTTSHNAKVADNQLPHPTTLRSIDFTRSVFAEGVVPFFTNVFNNPLYAKDFLPNNIHFHLLEFLHQGNALGKDSVYVRSVLRLFYNKLKALPYVNAYSFGELLSQLPDALERHFAIDTQQVLGSLKNIIYEIQYHAFMANFAEFKTKPETFLGNLSQQLENAAELRKLIVLLLETSIDRLIWVPSDQFETWQQVKTISHLLAILHERTIIGDLEDLNSLYVALIERYCYFLDVAGKHIDSETYQKIRLDIQKDQLPLLTLEEQQEYIETKLQRLSRCLFELESKSLACESGILIKSQPRA